MATSTGFKQQCPSCEALVPIRDMTLIGRKIDCPKCKYRFVVEEPEEKVEEVAPGAASKKTRTDITKIPAKGKAADAKIKLGAKKRRGEEDEADDEPVKKGGKKKKTAKSKDNNKMMIGLGLAGVGAIILGITAFLILKGGDDKSKSGRRDSQSQNQNDGGDGPKKDGGAVKDGGDKAKPAGSDISTVQLTNLLLNQTEHVTHIHFKNLLESDLGKILLSQLPDDYFQARLGFSIQSIDELIRTESFRGEWAFNLVHTTREVPEESVIKAMGLKPAPAAIKNHKYYITEKNNPWLNQLGRLSLSKKSRAHDGEHREGAVAVHFYNPYTLVFADEVAMQKFLEANRRPARQIGKREPPKEEKDSSKKDSSKKDSGKDGGQKVPVGPPMPPPMGPTKDKPKKPATDSLKPTDGRNPPKTPPPTGLPVDPGKKPPEVVPPKRTGGKGRAFQAPTPPNGPVFPPPNNPPPNVPPKDRPADPPVDDTKEDTVLADTYLTIDSRLAEFLRERGLEDNEKVLFKSAILHQSASKAFKQAWDITNWFAEEPKAVEVIGSALIKVDDLNYIYRNGLLCKNKDRAGDLQTELEGAIGEDFAQFFSDITGVNLKVIKEEAEEEKKGEFPEGERRPPNGERRGAPQPKPPMGGDRREGRMNAGQVPPPGPDRRGPNTPPPDKREDKEPAKPVTGIRVTRTGRLVLFQVTLILNSKERDDLRKAAGLVLAGIKGELDLESGQPHVAQLQRLGGALKLLPAQNKGSFPLAARERKTGRGSLNYPWEPENRVSWMAELLPHLGYGKLHETINDKLSWRDKQNLLVARTLIPEFLDPSYPRGSHYVSYPGLKTDVAATHFVGIAGIGEDVADDLEKDPEAAKRLGVFGYNRMTPVTAMERGTSRTAVMIQVPPTYGSPWMAGGGSTVRGIPETGNIKPFVSVKLPNGDQGTYVLMADGSVRWVSSKISPQAFKALCTIKGGASIMDDEWKPVPKGNELEAQPKPPQEVPKK
jgi:hypothetical protein